MPWRQEPLLVWYFLVFIEYIAALASFLFRVKLDNQEQQSFICAQGHSSEMCHNKVPVWSLCPSKLVWIALTHLPLEQNGSHFAGDVFKYIFVNEKFYISINISLKFVPKGPINNIPALVRIMAFCRIGDELLSHQSWPSSLTRICGTRGRWVK